MESETELEAPEEGATLLLLGVPQYTVFGIDTQVFSVGPEFKGIKLIPPGPHFVYYSSSNRSGSEFSPVAGFFIYTSSSDIIVRKWDEQEERLVTMSEDEEERYQNAAKGSMFVKQLGPYPINQYAVWKRLSSFITKAVIERIEPIGGEITVCSEYDVYKDVPKTASEKALTEQLKNRKISSPTDVTGKRRCYYTMIPRLIKEKGVSGQELTYLNLDKTQLLETMLAKEYGGCEEVFLGEMQFAFVAFLMGQSLEAFMQWKSIVSLMLSCTEAALHDCSTNKSSLSEMELIDAMATHVNGIYIPFRTRSHLFTKFIRVIYHQLQFGLQKDSNSMGEKGTSALLDDSWFTSDSFLYHLYKDFFLLVQESSSVDGDLLSWTRRLKDLLEAVLGWVFEQKNAINGIYFDEDDEFAPVVEMVYDDSNHAGRVPGRTANDVKNHWNTHLRKKTMLVTSRHPANAATVYQTNVIYKPRPLTFSKSLGQPSYAGHMNNNVLISNAELNNTEEEDVEQISEWWKNLLNEADEFSQQEKTADLGSCSSMEKESYEERVSEGLSTENSFDHIEHYWDFLNDE
ncbi:unnamed protein product [Rhodiola kirilowii]